MPSGIKNITGDCPTLILRDGMIRESTKERLKKQPVNFCVITHLKKAIPLFDTLFWHCPHLFLSLPSRKNIANPWTTFNR